MVHKLDGADGFQLDDKFVPDFCKQNFSFTKKLIFAVLLGYTFQTTGLS